LIRKSIILLLLLLFFNITDAQKIEINVIFNDTTIDAKKLISYTSQLDFFELKNELTSIFNQLQNIALLNAYTDSIIIDSNYYNIYIHLGKKYKWTALTNKNIDEEILSKLGFRDKLYNNRPFNERQLKYFFNKVISHYENNGFPFASFQLDSFKINNNKLSAQLMLNKNHFYNIDSIIIKGNPAISNQYIQNHIKIKEGDVYNEELIRNLSIRIKELPFIVEEKQPKIVFSETKAKILLTLKKKSASRFNGILGFLPDNETKELRITGDVKLNLINALKKGEHIDFNWRSLTQNTQDLKLKINYPFIFNSSFGIDYDFKLFKKDSLFIDVQNKIGLRYILKGNNYFSLFYHNKTSNLLSTTGFKTLTVLPSYADVSSNLYGIGLHNSRVDYSLNPKKGYTISVSGSLGEKNIQKHPEIEETLYENINLNTAVYNSELKAAIYIPFKKRSVIKLETKNAYTFNENLFENELLRIGGLFTLRGFDDESIFASTYSIGTIEYRFILEQNSYLYAFFDAAYYENNNVNYFEHDTPYGFGAGMSFETKAGIFSINYAIGKQFNNPLQFGDAKIHFGFVNFF